MLLDILVGIILFPFVLLGLSLIILLVGVSLTMIGDIIQEYAKQKPKTIMIDKKEE